MQCWRARGSEAPELSGREQTGLSTPGNSNECLGFPLDPAAPAGANR
jgi:hypothetical protein